MKLLFRIVAVILFVVFFGFALKNTQDTTLRFFLDYTIHAPLVLMLLAFFAAGAVLGILAMTPTVFRYRRELGKSKQSLQALTQEIEAQKQARAQPPRPDAM